VSARPTGPPNRPPPILVPAAPRGTAARRRRRTRVAVAGAVVLAAVAAGVAAAARGLERRPGAAARISALAAGGKRRAAAAFGGGDDADGPQPARRGRLACVPAVTVGAPGELRPVATLGPGDRATAIFQWPPASRAAGTERQAVRTLASARGVAVATAGRGAVVATADGPTLRALAARAPAAAVHLAVAGTRELCVVD
jgi:hypothetical protein